MTTVTNLLLNVAVQEFLSGGCRLTWPKCICFSASLRTLVHIDAIWLIRLNDPCLAAMRAVATCRYISNLPVFVISAEKEDDRPSCWQDHFESARAVRS